MVTGWTLQKRLTGRLTGTDLVYEMARGSIHLFKQQMLTSSLLYSRPSPGLWEYSAIQNKPDSRPQINHLLGEKKKKQIISSHRRYGTDCMCSGQNVYVSSRLYTGVLTPKVLVLFGGWTLAGG